MYYVYKFLDNSNNVIYVGYSTCLNSRIDRQHFQNQGTHLSKEVYNMVKSVEYLSFDTKEKASFNEMYYIFIYNPQFNTVYIPYDETLINEINHDWKVYCYIQNGKVINKTNFDDSINLKHITFGSTVDIELYTKLKQLSETSQIPISKLLDNAIKLLLKSTER